MRLESSHPSSMNIYITYLLFRNENIISYKESFMEDATQTLNIVMEFADNGDLL
jgi:serine/threonine protein kinase